MPTANQQLGRANLFLAAGFDALVYTVPAGRVSRALELVTYFVSGTGSKQVLWYIRPVDLNDVVVHVATVAVAGVFWDRAPVLTTLAAGQQLRAFLAGPGATDFVRLLASGWSRAEA